MKGIAVSTSGGDAYGMKFAIRSYPAQYVQHWALKDNTPVLIRPILPEDEPLMVKFHEGLSERSVYFRYFQPLHLSRRVAHDRLTRICFNDYDRGIALVVDGKNQQTGAQQILGVGRLSRLHGANEAEFALVISDLHQGQGLGTELLARLLDVGREEKLSRIVAEILPENRAMQSVCKKLGFDLEYSPEERVVRAAIRLSEPTD
ncbi:MAG: GNAT family N-acetyltransferase [Verrucomicrobiales bacterium]|nr:GNAT family N-acetyltransferase [Verrucomicrobiales bacterium]